MSSLETKIREIICNKVKELDRSDLFRASGKNEKLLEKSIRLYKADTCGKCISVCPFAYIE